jgi:hypothetical protein
MTDEAAVWNVQSDASILDLPVPKRNEHTGCRPAIGAGGEQTRAVDHGGVRQAPILLDNYPKKE